MKSRHDRTPSVLERLHPNSPWEKNWYQRFHSINPPRWFCFWKREKTGKSNTSKKCFKNCVDGVSTWFDPKCFGKTGTQTTFCEKLAPAFSFSQPASVILCLGKSGVKKQHQEEVKLFASKLRKWSLDMTGPHVFWKEYTQIVLGWKTGTSVFTLSTLSDFVFEKRKNG